ncbi:uncharacterized protein IWZ02DRAFT_288076 [Phyllosticta citriasiana]|uniref:uncharacterized protein n=1 Tax=Phyllosticta citriasiana TaxID=595635 RepID=UPI0030FDD33C
MPGRCKANKALGCTCFADRPTLQHFSHLSFVVQHVFIKQESRPGRQTELLQQTALRSPRLFHAPGARGNRRLFLKHCLHNSGDDDCVRILKAIAPALEKSRPETCLIIAENVLSEWDDASLSRQLKTELLQDDISMLLLFNAKKRTAAQYEALLSRDYGDP